MPIGAYPGTFDPPTVAHLAIAEAALVQGGLDQVHLVVSRQPLGKNPTVPRFEHRIEVLEAVAARFEWLQVRVTSARLVVDVARGYDAVIMGTDKWLQVADPSWYSGSVEERDRVVEALPRLLLAERPDGRPDVPLPPDSLILGLPLAHRGVSSTGVRSGATEWMLPEAAAFDALTGAWTNPDAYLARRDSHSPGAAD
jgi:nicotinate-nucleotide adenylyltransferase